MDRSRDKKRPAGSNSSHTDKLHLESSRSDIENERLSYKLFNTPSTGETISGADHIFTTSLKLTPSVIVKTIIPVVHEPERRMSQITISSGSADTSSIDRKISNLENLIKKLQGEIDVMTDELKQSIRRVSSSETMRLVESIPRMPDTTNSDINKPESKKKGKDKEPTSHCFPVILSDVGLNSNYFHGRVCQITDYDEDRANKFSEIRQNFSILWQSSDSNIDLANNKNDENEVENTEVINKLKSEICDKIESLSAMEVGQPLYNSKENIHKQ